MNDKRYEISIGVYAAEGRCVTAVHLLRADYKRLKTPSLAHISESDGLPEYLNTGLAGRFKACMVSVYAEDPGIGQQIIDRLGSERVSIASLDDQDYRDHLVSQALGAFHAGYGLPDIRRIDDEGTRELAGRLKDDLLDGLNAGGSLHVDRLVLGWALSVRHAMNRYWKVKQRYDRGQLGKRISLAEMKKIQAGKESEPKSQILTDSDRS